MISLPGTAPEAGTCSRAGCGAPAAWRIDWRNPRIHGEDRRKTWLACDDHVDFLRGFLESRAFPLSVQPFPEQPVPEQPISEQRSPIEGEVRA